MNNPFSLFYKDRLNVFHYMHTPNLTRGNNMPLPTIKNVDYIKNVKRHKGTLNASSCALQILFDSQINKALLVRCNPIIAPCELDYYRHRPPRVSRTQFIAST
jgi:hypothetical protein